MGGIYGDLIYHHGAGTRHEIGFHDDIKYRTKNLIEKNKKIRDIAAFLLFRHYNKYMSWLQGKIDGSVSISNSGFFFILGMHRSGTSCLAGSLEKCGLFLGEVSRYNKFNFKGNHELDEVINLHDEILAINGGNWSNPPEHISVNFNQKQVMNNIVSRLSLHLPCGLKEPRTLLLMDTWLETIGSNKCKMIGTYRHPVAVAKSLAKRNNISRKHAYKLWLRYNTELVRLHKNYSFPIIQFDLSDPKTYLRTVSALSILLGLKPNMNKLQLFIDESLDHEYSLKTPVPQICRKVYSYLQKNQYRPTISNDGLEALILELLAQQQHVNEITKSELDGNAIHDKIRLKFQYLIKRNKLIRRLFS